MNKHKHHIVPRYRCKELGIDPDFPENIVEVTRKDHALIHWGYFCDDLEPLFEYVTPSQEIIDLIPRGDNRDVGGAVLNARGEIDGIDMSGKNNPSYKHGRTIDPEMKLLYKREWWASDPERNKRTEKKRPYRDRRLYHKEYRAKKKAESYEGGSLEGFLT